MYFFFRRATFASCVVITLAAGSAPAALVSYEGFDYSAGPLTPQNGNSSQWASAWRTPSGVSAAVAGGSLSYPALATSGAAVDTSAGGTTLNFRDTGLYNSGDVWFSFLAKPEAQNSITGGSNFFGLTLYDGTDAGNGPVMGIAKNSTTSKWGIVVWGTNASTTSGGSGPNGTGTGNTGLVNAADPDVVLHETYLLVGHVHFATGAGADLSDTFSLYVNPAVGAPLTATPNVQYIDANGPTMGGMQFDRLRIASQNGRDWLYDEIRIGDSFADVAIPEPSALVLAGIGLAAISIRRKKGADLPR